MTTPKGTSLNYAKFRNQKRNNSNVDIEKDVGLLSTAQELSSAHQNSEVRQINNTNGLMQTNKYQNQYNTTQMNQNTNSQQDHSNQGYNQNNQGYNNSVSTSNPGNGFDNKQNQGSSSHHQQQQESRQSQQTSIQGQKNTQNYESNPRVSQERREEGIAINQAQQGSQQQQQQQQQKQQLHYRNVPSDTNYQSNEDYIDQMIRQKKFGDEPQKNKSKSLVGKTPVPSFMKNIHVMQQLQQQQEMLMKTQKNSKQSPITQQQQQSQQQSNDTVRINQKPQGNSSLPNKETQDLEDTLQNDDPSQKQNEQSQPVNQDEKLTQRKTIGSSQPKLFDQFFRNSSYHVSSSQSGQHSTQITTAQTQRNSNTQEKIQNISVLSGQSETKNSNSNSQIFTQPNQSQPVQHQNHFNTSPSDGNQNATPSHIHQHQNHHLSSVSNPHSNPITNRRDSRTSIHQHQNNQQQQQQQQQSNSQNHHKKESSLFNSMQSTILNNSIGNISPTAQFNNLDSSQFNISNISNIQNISNNVSSINNQSNIMINYNANNMMNHSNANSTMSFQKQFDEISPEKEQQGDKHNGNNDFLNQLSVYIDYFNNNGYENEKQIKLSQQSNSNFDLSKENMRLKAQIEQLEEKLKETETSRKILINDLSQLKSKDNEYKKKMQLLIKENYDTKALLQSINYKLHHTQEQYAKEKIEHENTIFTLNKVLKGRNANLENYNFSNNRAGEKQVRQQKVNNNNFQRKNFSQQFQTLDNRTPSAHNKLAINPMSLQSYQKNYPSSYQNFIDSSNNLTNGKQVIGSRNYNTNSTQSPLPLSNIMINQQQIFDGETGMSRIIDPEEKLSEPIYAHQAQASTFPSQIVLQSVGQEGPMMVDRYTGPVFGGSMQGVQQNEFDELECKDFNLDDSNQNLDGGNYQDNPNMIIRDDFTDNTTDIVNLNQPSPSIPINSGITASTAGRRIGQLQQSKYQNMSSNNPIYSGNQQVSSNNKLGYNQQLNNDLQDQEFEEDDDMDLSDNFNLDTDNQLNEEIGMLNQDKQIQSQGYNPYEALAPQFQSDTGIIQDDQQYYDYQTNRVFNTIDNSNFKYSTHRDVSDQNNKNTLPYYNTSYKKGASSLDEDHIYQMMKIQHHPNSYEMNRLNLNMNMKGVPNINQNSMPNPAVLKSQLKKQQQQMQTTKAVQQSGRTMSLSLQKPQFNSQAIQQVQLMQSQKNKALIQQQQQQYLQQPFSNYQ